MAILIRDDDNTYICDECKCKEFVETEALVVSKEEHNTDPNYYNFMRPPIRRIRYLYKCLECGKILKRGSKNYEN